jgi:hypothetical protein
MLSSKKRTRAGALINAPVKKSISQNVLGEETAPLRSFLLQRDSSVVVVHNYGHFSIVPVAEASISSHNLAGLTPDSAWLTSPLENSRMRLPSSSLLRNFPDPIPTWMAYSDTPSLAADR